MKADSRKPWTQKEDEAIKTLVKKFGIKRWADVSSQLQSKYKVYGRTGKQCRQRWHNHLNPQINKNPWTTQQQQIIFQGHRKYGNQWTQISKLLEGRTDNSIKNYFYSTLRKALRRVNKILGSKNSTTIIKTIKPAILSEIFYYSGLKQDQITQKNAQLVQDCKQLSQLLVQFSSNSNNDEKNKNLKNSSQDLLIADRKKSKDTQFSSSHSTHKQKQKDKLQYLIQRLLKFNQEHQKNTEINQKKRRPTRNKQSKSSYQQQQLQQNQNNDDNDDQQKQQKINIQKRHKTKEKEKQRQKMEIQEEQQDQESSSQQGNKNKKRNIKNSKKISKSSQISHSSVQRRTRNKTLKQKQVVTNNKNKEIKNNGKKDSKQDNTLTKKKSSQKDISSNKNIEKNKIKTNINPAVTEQQNNSPLPLYLKNKHSNLFQSLANSQNYSNSSAGINGNYYPYLNTNQLKKIDSNTFMSYPYINQLQLNKKNSKNSTLQKNINLDNSLQLLEIPQQELQKNIPLGTSTNSPRLRSKQSRLSKNNDIKLSKKESQLSDLMNLNLNNSKSGKFDFNIDFLQEDNDSPVFDGLGINLGSYQSPRVDYFLRSTPRNPTPNQFGGNFGNFRNFGQLNLKKLNSSGNSKLSIYSNSNNNVNNEGTNNANQKNKKKSNQMNKILEQIKSQIKDNQSKKR